jgi:hypothetical protein
MILSHHDFAPHVGRDFRFTGWHGVLRLAKVDVQPPYPGDEREPFALIFHGPAGDILPEGLYEARPDGGAATAFYIMPIHTASRDRQDYQAVFN